MSNNTTSKRANGDVINAILCDVLILEESQLRVEYNGKETVATYWEYPNTYDKTLVVKLENGEEVTVSFNDIIAIVR